MWVWSGEERLLARRSRGEGWGLGCWAEGLAGLEALVTRELELTTMMVGLSVVAVV